MSDSMVTGRMDAAKKEAGNAVLAKAGLNASQAINLMYDLLVKNQDACFLKPEHPRPSRGDWASAMACVDALVLPWDIGAQYDDMGNGDIARARLARKGMI